MDLIKIITCILCSFIYVQKLILFKSANALYQRVTKTFHFDFLGLYWTFEKDVTVITCTLPNASFFIFLSANSFSLFPCTHHTVPNSESRYFCFLNNCEYTTRQEYYVRIYICESIEGNWIFNLEFQLNKICWTKSEYGWVGGFCLKKNVAHVFHHVLIAHTLYFLYWINRIVLSDLDIIGWNIL